LLVLDREIYQREVDLVLQDALDTLLCRPVGDGQFDAVDADRGGTPGLITMRVVRDDGAGGYYVQQGSGAPAQCATTSSAPHRAA